MSTWGCSAYWAHQYKLNGFTSARYLDLSNFVSESGLSYFMSQSIPTGYIPPGNPRGLAQKITWGSGFDF